ncbi:hypothetical protein RRG08_063044 [Elysia crispata]|uniref:Sulfotransferase domain-containing protein n=1 Tax=Elysia crispata TaxID=231223 RepID=A0AAE0YI92_9GAST|nr:hypothetical protein RRG08_063044 [Elysia crispata]
MSSAKKPNVSVIIVPLFLITLVFFGFLYHVYLNDAAVPILPYYELTQDNCTPYSLCKENIGIPQRSGPVLEAKARRLPRALIIGFNKCGSAAWRSFLSIHPDIVSPTLELRFFTENHKLGLEWYRSQMPLSTSNQITIEKTPRYIRSVESLRRIYEFNPDVKLLVIVRNPVSRLQSEYAHEMAKLPETSNISFTDWIYRNPFEGFVTYWSDYASTIRRAFSVFPHHQFLVVSEEDLEKDPVSVVKQAEMFLKLRPAVTNDVFVFNETKGFYCFNTSHPFFPSVLENHEVDVMSGCMIETKGRDHPSLDANLLHRIVNTSLPYVRDLFRLIHKQFDWKYYNKYIQEAC